MTLDLTNVGHAQITVAPSPLAELMACLHALAEPDHHVDLRPWLERVSDQLSAGLRAELSRFAPLWARRRSRLLLPLAEPLPITLEVELQRLADLPERTFVDSAASTIHGGDFDTSGLAAEPGRQAAYVEACEQRSFSRGELARALLADPASFRARLLSALACCREEFFDTDWSRLSSRLEHEAEQLRAHRQGSVVDMIRAVSPSATQVGDTRTVRFDKLQNLRVRPGSRAVVLVPTVIGRPHLIVRADEPFPVVLQFPVRAVNRPDTPASIQHRLAVLSDPNRLAICRHLVNETITTSELARRTGMPLAQVSRHLARLREVGLLHSERDGRYVRHRLDVAEVMQTGPRLIRAIVQ